MATGVQPLSMRVPCRSLNPQIFINHRAIVVLTAALFAAQPEAGVSAVFVVNLRGGGIEEHDADSREGRRNRLWCQQAIAEDR